MTFTPDFLWAATSAASCATALVYCGATVVRAKAVWEFLVPLPLVFVLAFLLIVNVVRALAIAWGAA